MENDMETMYERIAERTKNLILQNQDAIEIAFKKTLSMAENPDKVVFPIHIKIPMFRMGKVTGHKEQISWEVKSKEQVETPEEVFDPAQPDLFNE